MKRSTRMMLMSSGNNRRYNDGRSYDNYDVDDKFRDRRGREHYDNGRYAPRSEMMEPEDRGYRRYSDGRFAPRNDGGMWVDSRYWDDRMYGPQSHYGYPYVPPVYREDGSAYTERREMNRPMNKIGFAISGEGEMKTPREFDHDYRMDEMAYRKGGEHMTGYGAASGYIPFTKEMADEWSKHMDNEDGTRGAHWTLEQAKQVMAQRGIECDPVQFWAALNMVYSDYVKVAKKHGVGDKIDFYADMAKSFLCDKDAPEDKLARYYEYIVRG